MISIFDHTIDFEDLMLGMFLVANEYIYYPPPVGYLVTGIMSDGFNARDDRAHNVWFFKKEEMPKFRFYTDNDVPSVVREGINWGVFDVNYCLAFDVMYDNK